MESRFWDRVEVVNGSPRLRQGGGAVAEVLGRLESGETPARLAEALSLEPLDVVAALAFEALGDGPGPSLVQSPPRRPRLAAAVSEPALAGLYPAVPTTARLGLAAGLLQVFDFWDASHEAAQRADDLGERSVSAYWHGIAHRREPDAGNAAYWFRRVGRHPVFAPLADAARPLLQTAEGGASLANRLLPRGDWDPMAFIDVCTSDPGGQADSARALQRLEMRLLLEASLPS